MKTVSIILNKELNDVFNSIREITNGGTVDLPVILKHEKIKSVKGISGMLSELKTHGLITAGRKGIEVVAIPGKPAENGKPVEKKTPAPATDKKPAPAPDKEPVVLPEGVKGKTAKNAIKKAKDPVAPDPKKDLAPIPGTGKIPADKPSKSNTPKEVKDTKKSKFTRFDSFGIVLKRMLAQNTPETDGRILVRIADLAEQSDDVYHNNGGKLNIKESRWAVNMALATLTGLGVAEKINNELIAVVPRFIKAF